MNEIEDLVFEQVSMSYVDTNLRNAFNQEYVLSQIDKID